LQAGEQGKRQQRGREQAQQTVAIVDVDIQDSLRVMAGGSMTAMPNRGDVRKLKAQLAALPIQPTAPRLRLGLVAKFRATEG